ncbi:MAG: GspE/PulE family protein [Opitutales bacterium]
MFADHNAAVVDLLGRTGVVPKERLEEAAHTSRLSGRSVAETLLADGVIDRQSLLRAVAAGVGIAFEPSPPETLSVEQAAPIDAHFAHRFRVVPVGESAGQLTLLTADAFNEHAADDLAFFLGRPVELVLADPARLDALLAATYGEPPGKDEDPVGAEVEVPVSRPAGRRREGTAPERWATEASVIRLVDLILRQAIREGASDVHFEPFEDCFQVRFRIAGALLERPPPPLALALPVISRLKVLADLNIAEQRVPQDGRFQLAFDEREVDLRVSTLPTEFGESVVLRVLDKSVGNLDLELLGIPRDVLAGIRTVVRRPNGIFITTGPTGSGKTTTLFSALREVNDEETKILTAEDPIEYEIEGLVQTAINPAVGLDFAAALRAFLRQDPDKILVGEIRDRETARIAVQASLTGHLVLSTLHTNDAPGAVTRLLDMGVEPFLIAASLEAVLAQRLVRAICPACRRTFAPAASQLEALGLAREAVARRTLAEGAGCEECHRSGYAGRLGLFEWILLEDGLKDRIAARVPTPELRRFAILGGMRTLREDGLRALFEHRTTVDEVLRAT